MVRTGDATVWVEGTGHCVVKESDGEDWGCNCVGCLKKEEESMFIRVLRSTGYLLARTVRTKLAIVLIFVYICIS
jgi:hypothetical protein